MLIGCSNEMHLMDSDIRIDNKGRMNSYSVYLLLDKVVCENSSLKLVVGSRLAS